MEVFLTVARRLLAVLDRSLHEDLSLERLDYIQTEAERLLRVCLMLSTNLPLFNQLLPSIQVFAQTIAGIANQLEARGGISGYHPGFCSFSGRGRPSINLTREMLEYFINNGFTAPQMASILHVSLSTIRRRMLIYGLSINSLYSSISDTELDRLVRGIQEHYPNCGYRMMIGHLRTMGHRVQELRVRNSMMRTDPEGVVSRWITSIQRRVYSVATPNALWHIDGNHRLIRYAKASSLHSMTLLHTL